MKKNIILTEKTLKEMIKKSLQTVLNEDMQNNNNTIDLFYDKLINNITMITEEGIKEINRFKTLLKKTIDIMPKIINKASNGVISNARWDGDLPYIGDEEIEDLYFIADGNVEKLMSVPDISNNSSNGRYISDSFSEICMNISRQTDIPLSGLRIQNSNLDNKVEIIASIKLDSYSDFFNYFDYSHILEKSKK